MRTCCVPMWKDPQGTLSGEKLKMQNCCGVCSVLFKKGGKLRALGCFHLRVHKETLEGSARS